MYMYMEVYSHFFHNDIRLNKQHISEKYFKESPSIVFALEVGICISVHSSFLHYYDIAQVTCSLVCGFTSTVLLNLPRLTSLVLTAICHFYVLAF